MTIGCVELNEEQIHPQLYQIESKKYVTHTQGIIFIIHYSHIWNIYKIESVNIKCEQVKRIYCVTEIQKKNIQLHVHNSE